MLIVCDRHTKEDLELWQELERIDLYFATAKLKELTETAIGDIYSFASEGGCYASVSWGKDSVALAHLVCQANNKFNLNIPIVYLKQIPSENPYCLQVRDIFLLNHNIEYKEFTVDYTTLDKKLSADSYEKAGDKIFFGAIKEVEKLYSKRHITGIRADESKTRLFRYKRFGISSGNTCAPLSLWRMAKNGKGHDIFSYLAANDLPVHPNYAMLGSGRYDRNYIRVDELGGLKGVELGRSQWEKEYYQDILNQINYERNTKL